MGSQGSALWLKSEGGTGLPLATGFLLACALATSRGPVRLFALLGLEQVADLGQQLLILGGAGRGGGLFLLLLEGVDGF